MRHCHTQSASSMQSTTGACGHMKLQPSLRAHGPSRHYGCSTSALSQPAWTCPPSILSHTYRLCRHRTAAAAPDTLIAEESVQRPEIDFLGVLNDMQTVRGVLQTAADPDLVYTILTDYDSCSRVFRNISGSETLFSDAGDKQVVQVSSTFLRYCCLSDRYCPTLQLLPA